MDLQGALVGSLESGGHFCSVVEVTTKRYFSHRGWNSL